MVLKLAPRTGASVTYGSASQLAAAKVLALILAVILFSAAPVVVGIVFRLLPKGDFGSFNINEGLSW